MVKVQEFQFSQVRRERRNYHEANQTHSPTSRHSITLVEDEVPEFQHIDSLTSEDDVQEGLGRRHELLQSASRTDVGDRRRAYAKARQAIRHSDSQTFNDSTGGADRGRHVLRHMCTAIRHQVWRKNMAANWLHEIRNRLDEEDEEDEEDEAVLEGKLTLEDQEEDEEEEEGGKDSKPPPLAILMNICEDLKNMGEAELLSEVEELLSELKVTGSALEDLKTSLEKQRGHLGDMRAEMDECLKLSRSRLRRFEGHVFKVREKLGHALIRRGPSFRRPILAAFAQVGPSEQNVGSAGSFESAAGSAALSPDKESDVYLLKDALTTSMQYLEEQVLKKYRVEIEPMTDALGMEVPDFLQEGRSHSGAASESGSRLGTASSSHLSPPVSALKSSSPSRLASPWKRARRLSFVEDESSAAGVASSPKAEGPNSHSLLAHAESGSHARPSPLARAGEGGAATGRGAAGAVTLFPFNASAEFSYATRGHQTGADGAPAEAIVDAEALRSMRNSLVNSLGRKDSRSAADPDLDDSQRLIAVSEEFEEQLINDAAHGGDAEAIQKRIGTEVQKRMHQGLTADSGAAVQKGLVAEAESSSSQPKRLQERHTAEAEEVRKATLAILLRAAGDGSLRPMLAAQMEGSAKSSSSKGFANSHGRADLSSSRGFLPREVLPGIIVYSDPLHIGLSPNHARLPENDGPPGHKAAEIVRARASTRNRASAQRAKLSQESKSAALPHLEVEGRGSGVAAKTQAARKLSASLGGAAVERRLISLSEDDTETTGQLSKMEEAEEDLDVEEGLDAEQDSKLDLQTPSTALASSATFLTTFSGAGSKFDFYGLAQSRSESFLSEPMHTHTAAGFFSSDNSKSTANGFWQKDKAQWTVSHFFPEALPNLAIPSVPPTPGGWPLVRSPPLSRQRRTRIIKTETGADVYLPPLPVTPPRTAMVENMNSKTLEAVRLDRRRLAALKSHPSRAAQPRVSFPSKPWESQHKKAVAPFGGSRLVSHGRKSLSPVEKKSALGLQQCTSLPELVESQGYHHLRGWGKSLDSMQRSPVAKH